MFIHTYTCFYILIHIYTCSYVFTHIYMFIRICTYLYMLMYMFICLYMVIHIHTYIYIHDTFCFYFHANVALLSCKPYHDLTTLRLFYFHIHSTFCYDCSPGYYQPLSNQTECSACPAGTYEPDAGSARSNCTLCEPGRYSNASAR